MVREKHYDRKICFRIPTETYRYLELIASVMGLSVSELLRYATIKQIEELTKTLSAVHIKNPGEKENMVGSDGENRSCG